MILPDVSPVAHEYKFCDSVKFPPTAGANKTPARRNYGGK